MNPIEVKVEICFEYPIWEDVSAWTILAAGISITRGRDSENDDAISVGTCSLTLQNDDGRFSPDLPSAFYYPSVQIGAGLRVSVLVNGEWSVRFLGSIQSWSTGPMDETGVQATCAVTANDALGAFPSYTFRQASDEVIRNASGILYHWPMRGLSGDAEPLTGSLPLVDNGGDESLPGGLLPLDEGTDQHPLFTASAGKRKLTTAALPVSSPWRFGIVIMGPPTGSPDIFKLNAPPAASGIPISWSAANGFGYGANYVGIPPTWPAVIEVGKNALNSNIIIRVSGVATTVQIADGSNCALRGITINPTLSGGGTFAAGHAYVRSGTSSAADFSAFAAALLGSRTPSSQSVPQLLSSFTGGMTVTGAPVGDMTLPSLEGRDAAEVMGALVTGMGARLVAVYS